MKAGLLWFDNGKEPTAAKIKRAAEFYEHKYGARPTLAQINPAMPAPEPIEGIRVETHRSILPNHIWIGVEIISQYAKERQQ